MLSFLKERVLGLCQPPHMQGVCRSRCHARLGSSASCVFSTVHFASQQDSLLEMARIAAVCALALCACACSQVAESTELCLLEESGSWLCLPGE